MNTVTTRSYDNARSGANTQETVLTPAAVGSRGIKQLFTLTLPGDKRGCEAQPLVVPGVKVADGSTHDVVFLSTMANDVFAFDIDTGAQLWTVQLGNPIQGTQSIDSYLINDHWGILSTPVIDANAGVMYVCSWISPDGSVGKAQHFLHALSLRDGHEVHARINLEGTSYNPGHGVGVQSFKSAHRKQRAALLLVNGTVFIAFGSIAETAANARGWVIAADTASFKVTAAWTTTSRGSGGGIWHSGGGPAADANGFIYVITGNGDFDGVTDFAESIVKLQYKPPAGGQAGSLAAVDWWTPWTDDGRTGSNPEGEDELGLEPLPTNFRRDLQLVRAHGMHAMSMGSAWGDQDFGSGGPVLAPAAQAVLAAGKDGILYTANLQNMGKTQPANLAPGATENNFARLRVLPIFYTYFPGYQLSPTPTDPAQLNVWEDQRTHHLHGNLVLWNSAAHGWVHFCWGENGNLRAWALSNAGASTYLACSAEVSSPESPVPLGGMPGGMISLSANGNSGGIVWASVPYQDANMQLSAGRFLAYDAEQFGKYADGSGSIVPLWDSQQWNWQFTHNKFNRPVVWNGRVLLPTYDGNVMVLGLA